MAEFKIISDEEVRKAIPMSIAIDLMEDAFRQISNRTAVVPIRTGIEKNDHSARALFMPAYSPGYHLFGLKMVAVFPENTTKNLPAIQGKVLVIDDENGIPKGLIDAGYLTALRTGAASGLATRLLSSPDTETMAMFGTGTQATTQVDAICCVRNIKTVFVFGTSQEKTTAFCQRMEQTHKAKFIPGQLSDLTKADVICTATTSIKPLFQLSHLKHGVLINGIGSYKPEMHEIASDVIKNCRLVVDQREPVLSEAGDIMIPIKEGLINENHIYAELGEIVSGKKQGGPMKESCTVFKSVGNAIQDLAIAAYLLKGS
ncbi:MAG TPA: hypothetical protein PKJ63_06935 [Cyclobacteriaceae bacterium]|nr:hypothetical protein [Cyclobacteriaceae bacterium]